MASGKDLDRISLDDRYDLEKKHIFASGTHAVIRLMMMQKLRDEQAGLKTAGYVTGYRGSPLGGVDQQFWRVSDKLIEKDIHFHTALNEDMAATAIWGTQQVALRGEGRVDGVFSIWYGKGPGVDRTGDVFRHANFAGTSDAGGVLALMGDDHTCESSTTAHQSEYAFVDAMMPVLNPAGVQEILDFGLLGFALSRYAGVWVGLKCVKDTIESTATVDGSLDRVSVKRPEFDMPTDGVNIRLTDTPLAQEERLHTTKLDAVKAFIAANNINAITSRGGKAPKIGLVSTGKSYLDLIQALDLLGLEELDWATHGIRILKIGCSYPLDPSIVSEFADGLEKIIVVEEKRGLIETQIREILYGAPDQTVVIGKQNETGDILFPTYGALSSIQIAHKLGKRLSDYITTDAFKQKFAEVEQLSIAADETRVIAERKPYFCAGCPHNSSTVIPEGSRAYAGIGCHYMVQWMDRDTQGYTHMGGEGANWIGESLFSKTDHVFQNIGDGTYNHSGLMAIRAAVASGAKMTYKILYNDAVAMTGGQANDGTLNPSIIAQQMQAIGAAKIVVVSDEPELYGTGKVALPNNVAVSHRDDLIPVQKELRETDGVSVMIYDQTCASEKRRRRKKNQFPDPDKRIYINPAVCESCGDCGVQSNCVAIQPLETELGRKRQIDQSACNKDFSCLKGFCPSFVTVHGAQLPKSANNPILDDLLAKANSVAIPETANLDSPKSIIVTGIGGTGIVTIGQIIGMAAHIDGLGAGLIDMAGLAQKGGAVTCHVKVAKTPKDISAIRIAAGEADVIIGSDMVVTGAKPVLSAISKNHTRAVVNTYEMLPGDFTKNGAFHLPTFRMSRQLEDKIGEKLKLFDATLLAKTLFADTVQANLILLGFVAQSGDFPVSIAALEKAIQLNGVQVERNLKALNIGRLTYDQPDTVLSIISPKDDIKVNETVADKMARFKTFLSAYQNKKYADLFEKRIENFQSPISEKTPYSEKLVHAAMDSLFKLMTYKDEYEVARLYTQPAFLDGLKETFASHKKIELHLAPPFLSKIDPVSGRPKKSEYGPWIFKAFKVMKKFKFLRGGGLDPFGRTEERQKERELIANYVTLLGDIAQKYHVDHHETILMLLKGPQIIKGFGPVKLSSIEKYEAQAERNWAKLSDSSAEIPTAAE